MMTGQLSPLLRFDAVSYRTQGRTLIDDLKLDVLEGERLLIIGPNGAGKSTLLRLGHQLLRPSQGRILGFHTHRPESFMSQRPVMLRRSALGNLAIALEAQGVGRAEARRRAAQSLETQGMSGLARQNARGLSGGEQQRLALMRATITKPRLLWLDEPTASLDPAASRQIEQQLLAISASGTTLVMVAHDLAQTRRLADRVALLHQGRLVELSAAAQFFRKPESELGQKFLAGEHLA